MNREGEGEREGGRERRREREREGGREREREREREGGEIGRKRGVKGLLCGHMPAFRGECVLFAPTDSQTHPVGALALPCQMWHLPTTGTVCVCARVGVCEYVCLYVCVCVCVCVCVGPGDG